MSDRYTIIWPDDGGAVIIKLPRPWPAPMRLPVPQPVDAEVEDLPDAA